MSTDTTNNPLQKRNTCEVCDHDQISECRQCTLSCEPNPEAFTRKELVTALEAQVYQGQAASSMLAALKNFVTETRAYCSPECDECDIVGPLLREADAAIAGAEKAGIVPNETKQG